MSFVVSHAIVPNPVKAWVGLQSNPEIIQAYTLRYHLNDPLWEQYFYYVYDLATGNWGISPTTGRPVLQEIATYFPATLQLVLASVILSFIVGVPLGALAAVKSGSKVDYSIRSFYLLGVSSPPFLVALILQLVFSYYFNVFPSIGEISPSITPPKTITGMIVVDSLLERDWPSFWSSIHHLMLPTISLTILIFGLFGRLMRSSMLDVLGKDYIRAARAKGLGKTYVNLWHAMRTALIPPVTILAVAVGQLLGGALVIEYVFGIPGMGTYTVEAITTSNFPDIIGVTTIFALGVIISNLIADILYALLDPRIRI
ncbi:MAG: ABC transporter permease [Thermoprotei archaeon]